MRESKAAIDLMYRRSRCLADFDTANKNLDKARQKNKDLSQAEAAQQNVKTKFENMSEKAKEGPIVENYLFHSELNCSGSQLF